MLSYNIFRCLKIDPAIKDTAIGRVEGDKLSVIQVWWPQLFRTEVAQHWKQNKKYNDHKEELLLQSRRLPYIVAQFSV